MKLEFTEPAAEGSGAIDVYVFNPDHVHVSLSGEGRGEIGVCTSYWQLSRILERIRSEFPQIDREDQVLR